MIAIEQRASAASIDYTIGRKMSWPRNYLRLRDFTEGIETVVVAGDLAAEDSTRGCCLFASADVIGFAGLLAGELHSHAATHQLIVLAEEHTFPLGATAAKALWERAHIEGSRTELLFNIRGEAPR